VTTDFRGVTAVTLALLVAGCGMFLPGFEGPFGIHSWTHKVPVKAAAQQVQCELYHFLWDENKRNAHHKDRKPFLDPDQAATLQLKLISDNKGNVTYVGLDLTKIGLISLANVVAVQNKVPSLQVGATLDGQVSSQIEFTIPQSMQHQKGQLKDASGKSLYFLDQGSVPPKYVPAKVDTPPIPESVCEHPQYGLAVPLDLQKWLERFLENYREDYAEIGSACMTKLTLSTQFQFVFDAKSGINPIGGPFILPVSGLNGEFSPAFTHSLQIVFGLNKCPVGPQASPSIASMRP
jgi:hypothetical protein